MGAFLPTVYAPERAVCLLVVEDHDSTRETLTEGLRLYGHRVFAASTCDEARRLLRKQHFDAVLLDVNLPDASGYELLRAVRGDSVRSSLSRPDLPVLMVSGDGGEGDRVRGFELGCDDYLVKPYSFGELRGRLAAVLRRVGESTPRDLQYLDELVIDHHERRVELAGLPVRLTAKEWGLLAALASDATRLFTREQLLHAVWGFHSGGATRTLDAHACRLRRKLAHGSREYVVNVWGVGYRLCDPSPVDDSGEQS